MFSDVNSILHGYKMSQSVTCVWTAASSGILLWSRKFCEMKEYSDCYKSRWCTITRFQCTEKLNCIWWWNNSWLLLIFLSSVSLAMRINSSLSLLMCPSSSCTRCVRACRLEWWSSSPNWWTKGSLRSCSWSTTTSTIPSFAMRGVLEPSFLFWIMFIR